MEIDEKLVEYVARLSRLKLTKEEKHVIVPQMRKILNYVEQLETVDVSSVSPMDHILELENVYRDDVPIDSFPREDILKNAPDSDGTYFEVPKII